MIKIIDNIDTVYIYEEYLKLEKDIQWSDFGHKGKQAGVQYKEDEDMWTSAVGKSKGIENSYNILNPLFKDTIFEQIILNYNLTRTRLMWVGPFACYSMHKDTSRRVHVPIVTNPNCYFLFKNFIPQHLSIGQVYLIDTRKDHTFINCSEFPRLHLIGCTE